MKRWVLLLIGLDWWSVTSGAAEMTADSDREENSFNCTDNNWFTETVPTSGWPVLNEPAPQEMYRCTTCLPPKLHFIVDSILIIIIIIIVIHLICNAPYI